MRFSLTSAQVKGETHHLHSSPFTAPPSTQRAPLPRASRTGARTAVVRQGCAPDRTTAVPEVRGYTVVRRTGCASVAASCPLPPVGAAGEVWRRLGRGVWQTLSEASDNPDGERLPQVQEDQSRTLAVGHPASWRGDGDDLDDLCEPCRKGDIDRVEAERVAHREAEEAERAAAEAEAALSAADDQVAFPMPGSSAVVDLDGALVDQRHIFDLVRDWHSATLLPTSGSAGTELGDATAEEAGELMCRGRVRGSGGVRSAEVTTSQ